MTTVDSSELRSENHEHFETTDTSLPPVNTNTNTSSTPNENPDSELVTADSDPQVAALRAMFPDFDTTILHTVLESVSGDQDRAIDVLLGMSDPSYQPTAQPNAAQTDLDEEFARNLMLEESHQRVAWRPRNDHVQPPTAPSSTNESTAQIQEQLNRFAETSKRTIVTLFSKVKAKIQELDNPTSTSNEQPRATAYRHAVSSQFSPQATQPSEVTFEPVRPAAATESYGYDVTPHESFSAKPPSAPLNPSSIGLLPKRPVTLDSSPLPSNVGVADDDELEYVTNPFEESERK